MNVRCLRENIMTAGLDFIDEIHERNGAAERLREAYVLGFCGTEGDLSL